MRVFVSWSLSTSISKRFWLHFGIEIGPKWAPQGFEIRAYYLKRFPRPRTINFGIQHAPNLPPNVVPSWAQSPTQIRPKSIQHDCGNRIGMEAALQQILGPLWIHFGRIWGTKTIPKSTKVIRKSESTSHLIFDLCGQSWNIFPTPSILFSGWRHEASAREI